MAIDFNNKPSNNPNSGSNPFSGAPRGGQNAGASGQRSERSSGGFSFGGSGRSSSGGGSSSGSGFNPGDSHAPQQDRGTGKKGFPELPAVRNETRDIRRTGSTQPRRTGSSFSSQDIPWRAIIYFLLIIAAVGLLICFWDTITYVISNLIAMMFLIVILLLLIRWLSRPRRR